MEGQLFMEAEGISGRGYFVVSKGCITGMMLSAGGRSTQKVTKRYIYGSKNTSDVGNKILIIPGTVLIVLGTLRSY